MCTQHLQIHSMNSSGKNFYHIRINCISMTLANQRFIEILFSILLYPYMPIKLIKRNIYRYEICFRYSRTYLFFNKYKLFF